MPLPFDPPWLSSAESLAFVTLTGGVALGATAHAARAAARALADALRWRRAFADDRARAAPLRPGRVVLEGHARYLDDAGPPVRVVVRQEGTVHNGKQGQYTVWNERSRTIEARPFALELASGARVRVEPAVGELEVHDAFDDREYRGPLARDRTSRLTEGEQVWVSGVLRYGHDPDAPARGYRSNEKSLVLRAGVDEPLVLATEPLARRSLRDARFHSFRALLGVGALLALTAFGAGPMTRGLLFGRTVDARASAMRPVRVEVSRKNGPRYIERCQTSFVYDDAASGEPREAGVLTLPLPSCYSPRTTAESTLLRVYPGARGPVALPGRLGAVPMNYAIPGVLVTAAAVFFGWLLERERKREQGLKLDADR